MNPVPSLTNVHEALSEAAIKYPVKSRPVKEEHMEVTTFRIKPGTKEIAQKICQNHGTCLSAFARSCAEALVADYGVKDAEDKSA